ncbi:unnamed protein product [Didymodactylos carnosus]|uniref:Chitin-binding type-4 domain-containing protein n=1 Tax=Didymodactylos carnosus TaxID=1234261 RepID=A0A814WXX9_9BILA|nr:unnamed protein product [Didymodactylos carnosus]CAF1207630.1 unnamed protein product [Didymodactylos carnosus]CAF3786121.1 unnamed protein product [Didymodactylos carnosus]CAF3971751.1 unnamed protein product [Didymodactylos carnosus]
MFPVSSSLLIFICTYLFNIVHGHGRLEEPPARNAAWRYGFNIPANYDDVGLNCGGLGVQKSNDGKCGICGDSYSGTRYHETGGKYATGTIVRTYSSGSMIDIKVLLSANHKGYMEFRLCPSLNEYVEITQECLDQHVLEIEGYGKQFPVREGMDSIYLKVHLPSDVWCSHCVIQWRYHAGNNWGIDLESGKQCLGCGYQEEFYNCADITIVHNLFPWPFTSTISTVSATTQLPYDIITNPITATTITFPILFSTIPTTTVKTTTSLDVIIPFNPLELFTDSKEEAQIKCYATSEALKPLVGIEKWCKELCKVDCPPSLCVCIEI